MMESLIEETRGPLRRSGQTTEFTSRGARQMDRKETAREEGPSTALYIRPQQFEASSIAFVALADHRRNEAQDPLLGDPQAGLSEYGTSIHRASRMVWHFGSAKPDECRAKTSCPVLTYQAANTLLLLHAVP
jgi:hypothetical protein